MSAGLGGGCSKSGSIAPACARARARFDTAREVSNGKPRPDLGFTRARWLDETVMNHRDEGVLGVNLSDIQDVRGRYFIRGNDRKLCYSNSESLDLAHLSIPSLQPS